MKLHFPFRSLVIIIRLQNLVLKFIVRLLVSRDALIPDQPIENPAEKESARKSAKRRRRKKENNDFYTLEEIQVIALLNVFYIFVSDSFRLSKPAAQVLGGFCPTKKLVQSLRTLY